MVGLFGVLSYTTARRTREIGVRTALGARPRDVAGLVIRQALTVSLAGTVLGLLIAYVVARSISSLLYGVTTTDVVSFAAPPMLLIATSLAACAIPARRAARVDPIIAMKSE
jgi:ABC-type antimicrobial peptide transport system permease subunit